MVDLEIIGKRERQAHRDTLISAHTVEQVAEVAHAIGGERMIVRTNPLHDHIEAEVDSVLAHNPRYLMLPMVRNADEIRRYGQLVDSRAGIIPLVETHDGIRNIGEIASLAEVSEVYIGLNDLHLDLGCQFLFEPLASGMIEDAVKKVGRAGKPFGFGGIARLDEGVIEGARILGEHIRLGSSSVILSRTFHRRMTDNGALESDKSFAESLKDFRVAEDRLRNTDPEVLKLRSKELAQDIEKVALGC